MPLIIRTMLRCRPIPSMAAGTALLCLAGCATAELPPPDAPPPAAAVPDLPPPVPPRRPVHPLPRPKPPIPDAAAEDAPPEHIDPIGLEASALIKKLGEPETQTDSPPATIWHYSTTECALDLYLYRDLQTGALKALFVEMKGDDQSDQRRQSCYHELGSSAEGRRSDTSIAR